MKNEDAGFERKRRTIQELREEAHSYMTSGEQNIEYQRGLVEGLIIAGAFPTETFTDDAWRAIWGDSEWDDTTDL